jgi:hypothetical protein
MGRPDAISAGKNYDVFFNGICGTENSIPSILAALLGPICGTKSRRGAAGSFAGRLPETFASLGFRRIFNGLLVSSNCHSRHIKRFQCQMYAS